ncbi:spore germination protein [Bacillus sp. BRMEA1]|uniref:spore germination protein n=1 Tax=Neobacillus endophyticus TaxID=2738405 RepID=UPI001565ABD3|nr:spore germination protein [Neobacillus endophyticus]NRD78648.1 spore germination protein [Neobacillus endophyticus]
MNSIKIHRLKKKRMPEKELKIETDRDECNNLERSLLDYSLLELRTEVEVAFGKTIDLKIIEGRIGQTAGLLFYLDTMVDSKTLKETTPRLFLKESDTGMILRTVEDLLIKGKEIFGGTGIKLVGTKEEIYTEVLNGCIVVVVHQLEKAISINMETNEKRSVIEPSTQTVIRGPKDGFIESISTNVSLIRRRIRNQNLAFEKFIIGESSNTTLYLGYVKGIANEAILQEARNRLAKIKVSAIFESGNIEELICDKTFTVFPLALNTERPDTVAANLMEGKIVILIDGTPFALLIPAVFVNFFEVAEDYYQNFFLGSFLRFIRYLSFMIALLTPSIYVGILTFHQELLPTPLLLSVIAQREGVPFPAVVEVLLMEITFEILREAGIRMPRTVGQMVSIVGALVIGQAAAEAGIISNIMIIIVAITAISNFVAPVYSFAAASRLIRFLLIISASILGLYGVLIILVAMVAHLSSLRSFSIPYLAPIAPLIIEDQKDVFVRFPFWSMKKRPKYLRAELEQKVFSDSSPAPPPMEGGNNS